MSGTSPRRADPIARNARPLPATPHLDYERKQAKALLKQLHAGDPDALRRVQTAHPAALRDTGVETLQLADVQHVIAREYGFTSWPRMVEYFEVLERHRHAPRFNVADDGLARFEALAKNVVKRHERGDVIVARELAHFVPRFFARPLAEILAVPITLDEARLVVARRYRRASWEELIARGDDSRRRNDKDVWDRGSGPRARAGTAIQAHDVDALSAILDAHPELLTPSVSDREWRNTLGPLALRAERDATTPDARRITDLLAARGVDIQQELNELLLGWPQDGARTRDGLLAETVQWCLDRGADPDWLPPNGIPIVEHALARFRNPAAVDVIAARVTPRRALWIAAGLGDVAGVKRFIAGKGRLTPEGRLNRPDPVAMGLHQGHLPPHHDADDLEIMYEAFQIAGWNQRWAAMDALLAAGFPIDHSPFQWPLLREAVGNLMVPLAEFLVRRGADLDHDWPGHGSARATARGHVQYFHDPSSDDVRQLLAICGAGTVEEILAEIDATRQSPPPMDEMAVRVLQLAADDAARQAQPAITTEHLLVGVLRLRDGAFLSFLHGTGAEMPQLRALVGTRLLPDADPLQGEGLQLDAGAEAAIAAATAAADARRREGVGPWHLWYGLLQQRGAPGAQLLHQVGTKMDVLSERLASTM
ncbi:MAG: hypothetical protein KA267_01640 [Gemmatimonadales bacterium]|nr:hypothetical protein [Gemmatimonadales bacterium]MBP6570114.1 hypothetical protein [Gemmatimonadales bacterium]MBP7619614.1 hypothetical protein [Gemmatimonadales bacterium]